MWRWHPNDIPPGHTSQLVCLLTRTFLSSGLLPSSRLLVCLLPRLFLRPLLCLVLRCCLLLRLLLFLRQLLIPRCPSFDNNQQPLELRDNRFEGPCAGAARFGFCIHCRTYRICHVPPIFGAGVVTMPARHRRQEEVNLLVFLERLAGRRRQLCERPAQLLDRKIEWIGPSGQLHPSRRFSLSDRRRRSRF